MKLKTILYFVLALTFIHNSLICQELEVTIEIQHASCFGLNDGVATAIATGGTEPYEYIWSASADSQITQQAINLLAGTYSVTVTDNVGASVVASETISQPGELDIYFSNINHVSCNGLSDGYFIFSTYGGTPGYMYEWNDPCGGIPCGVPAGTYVITVTDSNSCVEVDSVTISQPEYVFVTSPWGGTICNGESFSTYVNATGGLGPYDFEWNASDNTTYYGEELNVSPTSTTTYELVVTDAMGCTNEEMEFTVTVHPDIEILSTESSADEICSGEFVSLTLDIQGGNGGPYEIQFADSDLIDLPYEYSPTETGWYVFNVIDGCGSPSEEDSIYVSVLPSPQQFPVQQMPSTGMLTSSNSGVIRILSSEIGTVYYIEHSGQTITTEIEGTGDMIEFGSNFSTGTYEIMSRKIDCGCVLRQGVVIFTNESGIDTNGYSNFKLFPNPAKDVICFEGIPKNTTFKLLDSKGSLVESGSIVDDKLNVTNLTSGSYLIVLFVDNKEISRNKFVVSY